MKAKSATVLLLLCAIASPSCESIPLNGALGAIAPGLIGPGNSRSGSGFNPFGGSPFVGGGIGGPRVGPRGGLLPVIFMAVVASYNANAEQKRIAEAKAARAQRSSTYQSVKKKKNVRYIAVQVPKDKSKSSAKGTDVALYDTKTGELRDSKVRVIEGKPKNGEVINVNGHEAMMSSLGV